MPHYCLYFHKWSLGFHVWVSDAPGMLVWVHVLVILFSHRRSYSFREGPGDLSADEVLLQFISLGILQAVAPCQASLSCTASGMNQTFLKLATLLASSLGDMILSCLGLLFHYR